MDCFAFGPSPLSRNAIDGADPSSARFVMRASLPPVLRGIEATIHSAVAVRITLCVLSVLTACTIRIAQ